MVKKTTKVVFDKNRREVSPSVNIASDKILSIHPINISETTTEIFINYDDDPSLRVLSSVPLPGTVFSDVNPPKSVQFIFSESVRDNLSGKITYNGTTVDPSAYSFRDKNQILWITLTGITANRSYNSVGSHVIRISANGFYENSDIPPENLSLHYTVSKAASSYAGYYEYFEDQYFNNSHIKILRNPVVKGTDEQNLINKVSRYLNIAPSQIHSCVPNGPNELYIAYSDNPLAIIGSYPSPGSVIPFGEPLEEFCITFNQKLSYSVQNTGSVSMYVVDTDDNFIPVSGELTEDKYSFCTDVSGLFSSAGLYKFLIQTNSSLESIEGNRLNHPYLIPFSVDKVARVRTVNGSDGDVTVVGGGGGITGFTGAVGETGIEVIENNNILTINFVPGSGLIEIGGPGGGSSIGVGLGSGLTYDPNGNVIVNPGSGLEYSTINPGYIDVDYGANITDISSTTTNGTSNEVARGDHTHQGVHAVSVNGTDLYGDVEFTGLGNNTVTTFGNIVRISGQETDISTHTGDLTIHFTETSISHTNIQDIGSNTHAQIDTHIADTSIHFEQSAIGIDASQVTGGSFADARISESSVTQHQAALSITESQISDLQNYALQSELNSASGTLSSPQYFVNSASDALQNEIVLNFGNGLLEVGSLTVQVTGYNGILVDSNGVYPDFSVIASYANLLSVSGYLEDQITGGASGAPVNAAYVVTSLNPTLSNEKLFTDGNGITSSVGGNSLTISAIYGTSSQNVGLSSSTGTSNALAREDHTHAGVYAIQTLPDGTAILGSISITGESGAVTKNIDTSTFAVSIDYSEVASVPYVTGISGYLQSQIGGGGAPTDAQYLVLSTDLDLDSERVFTPGSGLNAVDGGANGNYELSIDYSVEADIQSVADSNSAGTGERVARADHTHQGVTSIAISPTEGSLYGDVYITGQSGSSSVQQGNSIIITSPQLTNDIPQSVVPTDAVSIFIDDPLDVGSSPESARADHVHRIVYSGTQPIGCSGTDGSEFGEGYVSLAGHIHKGVYSISNVVGGTELFGSVTISGTNGITTYISDPNGDGCSGVLIVSGNSSELSGFLSDHGNLNGLLDDDHIQYLLINGTRSMEGNLDMSGYTGQNFADPTNPQDAATLNYVTGQFASVYVTGINGLSGGGTLSQSHSIGLDINNLTEVTVEADDYIAFADIDDNNLPKKVRSEDLVNTADHDQLTNFNPFEHYDHRNIYVSGDGTNLTGGGSIDANIILYLANTAVAPNTYGDASNVAQFTVDQQGRITNASEVSISITESQISDLGDYATNSKVDTLSGYTENHITNVSNPHSVTATQVGAASLEDFTGHTGNVNIHFTQAEISITESQISDLGAYALDADLTSASGYLQDQINTNISNIAINSGNNVNTSGALNSHTSDSNIHISHAAITVNGDESQGAITGGGTIDSNVSLWLADTAVTPGTYGTASKNVSITIDQQGRITSASQPNIDHGLIDGLSDDDHTQYVVLVPGTTARNTIQPTAKTIVPFTVKEAGASTQERIQQWFDENEAIEAYITSNSHFTATGIKTNFLSGVSASIEGKTDIDMGSNEVFSSSAPSSSSAYANKAYVDLVGLFAQDHSLSTNLDADDHLQYVRVDGTRGFTGVVSGVTPTNANHLATKQYVDDNAGGGGQTGVTLVIGNLNYIHLGFDTSQNVGGANGTITYIDWDRQEDVGSYYTHETVTNPSRIQVDVSGRYMVKATVSADNAGANRYTFRGFLRKNGTTTIDLPSDRSYSRGSAYNDISVNLYTELSLVSGDYLEVGIEVDDADGTYTVNTLTGQSEFMMRYLDVGGVYVDNLSGYLDFNNESLRDINRVQLNETDYTSPLLGEVAFSDTSGVGLSFASDFFSGNFVGTEIQTIAGARNQNGITTAGYHLGTAANASTEYRSEPVWHDSVLFQVGIFHQGTVTNTDFIVRRNGSNVHVINRSSNPTYPNAVLYSVYSEWSAGEMPQIYSDPTPGGDSINLPYVVLYFRRKH